MFYRILIKSLIWKSSEFGKVPNLEKFRIWNNYNFWEGQKLAGVR